jgi:ElaB/YqjD/DUF883 family membrane-anchored ribosome-binding protein
MSLEDKQEHRKDVVIRKLMKLTRKAENETVEKIQERQPSESLQNIHAKVDTLWEKRWDQAVNQYRRAMDRIENLYTSADERVSKAAEVRAAIKEIFMADNYISELTADRLVALLAEFEEIRADELDTGSDSSA